MKGKSRPILSLAIGTVLALASAEALLWVLGGILGTEERSVALGGGPTILCVGDSNTYGVHLEAEDSYPGQLQAFLDASGEHFTVVNQGCPGLNMTQVRLGLEQTIQDVDPVAVVVFAGVNDRWSNAGRPVWSSAGSSLGSTLLEKSRVLKLVRLVLVADGSADATTGGASVAERLPTGRFPPQPDNFGNKAAEETRTSIRTNLESIVATCNEWGAAVVFVGYPLFSNDINQEVNAPIRETAEKLGVPFVDLERRFRGLSGVFGNILYIPRDSHLSAVGNHESARLVLLALREAGVVVADPPPPPLEEAYGGITLTQEPDGDGTAIELTGPPGWIWRLRLIGRYAIPQALDGVRRSIFEKDEAGVPREELTAWRGQFDESGSSTTRLRLPPPPEHESFSGWELVALAVPATGGALEEGGNRRDVRFSRPLAISR